MYRFKSSQLPMFRFPIMLSSYKICKTEEKIHLFASGRAPSIILWLMAEIWQCILEIIYYIPIFIILIIIINNIIMKL